MQKREKISRGFREGAGAAAILASGEALTRTLQSPPGIPFCAGLAVLLLLCLREVRLRPLAPPERAFALGASLLLSLLVVLGAHISIGGQVFFGSIHENRILPFGPVDLVRGIGMVPAFWLLAAGLLRLPRHLPRFRGGAGRRNCMGLIALILFICWVPWLLLYWPGVLPLDAQVCIGQALDMDTLQNNHPVMVTLVIRGCLHLGQAVFGSNTAGMGLCTLLQMVIVALCAGYVIGWTWEQGAPLFSVVLWTWLFGTRSWYAVYSIAALKDPVFSSAAAALSVLLLEVGREKGPAPGWGKKAAVLLCLLLVLFTRHNGILAVGAVLLWQVCSRFWRTQRRGFLFLTLAATGGYLLVTGPVYGMQGIRSDLRESAGMMLQQMARVAASGGEMTPEERESLGKLLPPERYEEVYSPCCVDSLKWDPEFNVSPLGRETVRTWLSMAPRNLKTYLQAWVLESCGFWIPNIPKVEAGSRTFEHYLAGEAENSARIERLYEIRCENLLGDARLRELFPLDERMLPPSMLAIGTLLLLGVLLVRGQGRRILVLVPSLGILAGQVLGTPICTSPRYVYVLMYLLPAGFLLYLEAASGDAGTGKN